MKKILILLLTALVSITAVEAQQLSKRELKAQKKALQKEVAAYQAEGWTVAPGNLPLAEQLTRSKTYINALNEKGEPKYLIAEATVVAQTYKAALFSAQNGVKIEAANMIGGELTQLTNADLANVQENTKDAISVDKVVSAAREKVTATLSRGVSLVTMQREIKENGNVEVRLMCAYDYEKLMDTAMKAAKQSLQDEINNLRKKL